MSGRQPDERRPLQALGFSIRPRDLAWYEWIFDFREGKFLRRKPIDWIKIIIFYIIFYIILFAFTYFLIKTLCNSLSDDHPRCLQKQPGLNIHPSFTQTSKKGSSVIENTVKPISIDNSSQLNVDYYVNRLDKLLNSYKNFQKRTEFGPCNVDEKFGYNENRPCFFVKVNKIILFKPKFYESPYELPDIMPNKLQKYIKSLQPEERKGKIWIHCSPYNENRIQIDIYPNASIPGEMIMFHKNIKTILPYLLAIQLSNIPKNQIVTIECSMWARNVETIQDVRNPKACKYFKLEVK